MSEYIIEWSGIGADVTEMMAGGTPPWKVTKVIRHARLREPIVRCRDCIHYKLYRTHSHGIMNRCYDENGHTHRRDENDFCSRGERRTE